MESSSHQIQVPRTARYHLLGVPGPGIRRVYYVLHGYGQLAAFFIQNFQPVVAPDTLVVAPEALSRFYLDGVFGRVGASWMTKEDRLNEITDYLRYLDLLQNEVSRKLEGPAVENIVLGFSQGCATAWRWMMKGNPASNKLVLWAGSVPSESSAQTRDKLLETEIILAYGEQDPYIKAGDAEKMVFELQSVKPDLHVEVFDDGHRIPAEALRRVDRLLRG